jgi:hypothetical protein
MIGKMIVFILKKLNVFLLQNKSTLLRMHSRSHLSTSMNAHRIVVAYEDAHTRGGALAWSQRLLHEGHERRLSEGWGWGGSRLVCCRPGDPLQIMFQRLAKKTFALPPTLKRKKGEPGERPVLFVALINQPFCPLQRPGMIKGVLRGRTMPQRIGHTHIITTIVIIVVIVVQGDRCCPAAQRGCRRRVRHELPPEGIPQLCEMVLPALGPGPSSHYGSGGGR